MANMSGMDIQAVQNLATQMKTKAGEIQQIMATLTSQLQSAPWVGADQQRFLSEWQGQHCTALRNVISGLEQASQQAARNAQEQQAASA